jgi:hypothetical protein
MGIYPSTKPSPYVYILTHKITKQFYIGFRCHNVKKNVPSHLDIFEYQSSSKKVKNLGFSNFDVLILAEFFDKQSAYSYEQETIRENFKNPLCLNKTVFKSNHFVHSEETHKKSVETRKRNGNYNNKQSTREKISIAGKGRKHSLESRKKISISKKGKPGRKWSAEEKRNRSETITGVKKNNVLVSRIEDKKVMHLCAFTKWCNKSYNRPKKIGKYNKPVCRIYDGKQMTLGDFNRWSNKTDDHPDHYKRKVSKSYKKHICRIFDKKEMTIGGFNRWIFRFQEGT